MYMYYHKTLYLFRWFQGEQTGHYVELLAGEGVSEVKLLGQTQEPRSKVRGKLLPNSVQLTVLEPTVIPLQKDR